MIEIEAPPENLVLGIGIWILAGNNFALDKQFCAAV